MIDTLMQLGDLFLHIDRHLDVVIAQYGYWAYGLLFAIVFAETGLVIAPFLPGDSLLFIAEPIVRLVISISLRFQLDWYLLQYWVIP